MAEGDPLTLYWMPWSRRRRNAGPLAARHSFIIPTAAVNTCVLSTRSDLAAAGIEHSVGSVGDSYDNAPAETINGLYKTELIHRRGPWRSSENVEFATLERVDWFNNRPLMGPIGNISSAEAENVTTPNWSLQVWSRNSN